MTRVLLICAGLSAALFGRMAYLTQTALTPGKGMPIFDARVFGYGLAEAQAYLEALSEPGRQVYLGQMRLLDTAFPPLLAATLGLVLMAVTRPWHMWSRIVLLVPLAGYVVMDLAENALVAEMLRQGGAALDAETVALASEFTVTKWALLLPGIAMVAALALWRWLRPR